MPLIKYVDVKDPSVSAIIAAAFPNYKGKKPVSVYSAETVELSGTYWDGGSRSTYAAVAMQDPPVSRPLPRYNPPQFGGPIETPAIALQITPGKLSLAIVEHSIFCGKEMGLRIYVHPQALARLLPANTETIELTHEEKRVLAVTCQLKGGYRQANAGISSTDYLEALSSLKRRGLVAKNNAVTIDGRNTAEALKLRRY